MFTINDLRKAAGAIKGIPEDTVAAWWHLGDVVVGLAHLEKSQRELAADSGVSQSMISRATTVRGAFSSEVEIRRAFRAAEDATPKLTALKFLSGLGKAAVVVEPPKKVSASKKAAASIERTLKGLTPAQQKAALVQAAKDLGITL